MNWLTVYGGLKMLCMIILWMLLYSFKDKLLEYDNTQNLNVNNDFGWCAFLSLTRYFTPATLYQSIRRHNYGK